jgi:MSHA biogenesis protein MshJ
MSGLRAIPVAQWQAKLAAWVTRLSQRERWMVTGAAGIVLAMSWQLLLMDPLNARGAAVQARLAELEAQSASSAAAYEEALGIASGPEAVTQAAELKALRDREADLSNRMRERSGALVAPTAMVALLQDLIERHPGIELVRLRNLPVQPLGAGAAGARAPFYLHEVELVFEGDFASVMAYTHALERVPWAFYWKSLDFSVVAYPQNRVTLVLGVVSDQPTWMKI